MEENEIKEEVIIEEKESLGDMVKRNGKKIVIAVVITVAAAAGLFGLINFANGINSADADTVENDNPETPEGGLED